MWPPDTLGRKFYELDCESLQVLDVGAFVDATPRVPPLPIPLHPKAFMWYALGAASGDSELQFVAGLACQLMQQQAMAIKWWRKALAAEAPGLWESRPNAQLPAPEGTEFAGSLAANALGVLVYQGRQGQTSSEEQAGATMATRLWNWSVAAVHAIPSEDSAASGAMAAQKNLMIFS